MIEPQPRSVALPIEVQRLFRRERELATIVYLARSATAAEIGDRLEVELSNAAIRSMLNRLVSKAILRRTRIGKVFVYSPALTCRDSQATALIRFVQDYFDGSIEHAATIIPRHFSTAAQW